MSESLFGSLTAQTEELHQRTLNHKTVRGIGDGTLPEETFRYYIEQDYQYLTQYLKVNALAVVASDTLEVSTRLSQLVYNTFAVEMDALHNLYQQFGGDPDKLADIPRSPTCAAYTNHLLAVGAERNLLLGLAAMLPCQWGYREIGRSLKAQGLPSDERYSAWIEEYADDNFGEFVDWMIATLNQLAATAGSAAIERAHEVFYLSSEYEYRFWEMAWNREAW